MKHITFPSILLFVLSSCGSTPKNEEKLSAESVSSSSCYGSYTEKDSVFMQLTIRGEEVDGNLTYKLIEKDKNRGTIKGVMRGDTIFATYQFTSEGKVSQREVAFLKQGRDLVEGFAPMDETGTRFKNKNEVDFAGIVLAATDCND